MGWPQPSPGQGGKRLLGHPGLHHPLHWPPSPPFLPSRGYQHLCLRLGCLVVIAQSLLCPGVVFGSDPGVRGASAGCDRSFTATAQRRAGSGCCGVRKGGTPVPSSHSQGTHCCTHPFLKSRLKGRAKFLQLKTPFAALKHMRLHAFRRSHEALLRRLVQLP